MSLAVLKSRALSGMQALAVTVEVHLANGLPSFTIVGLPETEVKESKDRVRAAIQHSRFDFPASRITVNLAPADLPKESGRFDLPIALGILAASGQIPSEDFDAYEFAGELSLSGELRPIRGALAMTYAICGHHQHSNQNLKQDSTSTTSGKFILPFDNADEAALVNGAQIYPAKTLLEVCAHFMARDAAQKLQPHYSNLPPFTPRYADINEVKGQSQAKRALEIAAAGQHSVLMIGSPGTGKSMLASRFVSILPRMTDKEALESASVLSLSNGFKLSDWKRRPYRSPHHTASAVALVGGGSTPRPGEISLAHKGVLFLDELPEFDRKVLEVLREPLESGCIHISRAARQAEFPAQFQLIAAMNPCPCGYLGHAQKHCRCTPEAVNRYQSKISGPLLDRIDIQIEVAALPIEDLLSHTEEKSSSESSTQIQARVEQAFQYQMQRQGKSNQFLNTKEIDHYCVIDSKGEHILRQAITKFHWSARAYHRVLKVARTIADLEQSAPILASHIAEAVQYRRALKQD